MALRKMSSRYAISDCTHDNLSLRHRVCFCMFTRLRFSEQYLPGSFESPIPDDCCMQPEVELRYRNRFRGFCVKCRCSSEK